MDVVAGEGIEQRVRNVPAVAPRVPPRVPPPEVNYFRWLQHLDLCLMWLAIVFGSLALFFSTGEHTEVPTAKRTDVSTDDRLAIIFRQEFTWHEYGNGKGTLSIRADEEPEEKVYQFLLDNGLANNEDALQTLMNYVCNHDDIVCNLFGPVKIGEV